jgi:predicted signal transduction protein with EAL and GGDEF domain
MGFPVDQAQVDDLTAVTGVRAALLAQPMQGPPQLLAHSLGPLADVSVLARQRSDGSMRIDGELHQVASTALASGGEGGLSLRLAGSVPQAAAPLRQLQWLLALVTLGGMVLLGAGSLWTARSVTQPLRRLVQASERLGRGEDDEPVQLVQRGDEIGDLARAFEQMRSSLGVQRREIRDLAYRDRLTRLPNRLQFREDLQRAMAAADPAQQHIAVLMLDLDRFKHVNDVLGYASGDRLLERVAERLMHVVRAQRQGDAQVDSRHWSGPAGAGDVVARLGGDEFALLMRGADETMAMAVAQRIVAAFEEPLELDDHKVDLSAGVGIAVWPQHATQADALLSHAEVAMYAAKRHLGGAEVYDPSVDTTGATNLSLLGDLRQAVEGGELRLYLQPKIAISDGSVSGAEALVRWQHPTRGMVQPAQFIPFAEQTGFIRQLTLWIFEQAAAEQVALAMLGVRRVSVNLSTRDLLDPELPEKLDMILRRHHALADGFCLEITESAIMDDPQRAAETLNRLADRGYKLSIDDFGTGYSSLAYLKRLPVHELKIDKSFVMAMESDAGDAKIVRSTIDLAHNLGLSVVAEGVENEAVLSLLHALQCDEGQGYHMSKPLPVAEFCDWVSRWQVRAPARPGLAAELAIGSPLIH